jgi:hypothetical protein
MRRISVLNAVIMQSTAVVSIPIQCQAENGNFSMSPPQYLAPSSIVFGHTVTVVFLLGTLLQKKTDIPIGHTVTIQIFLIEYTLLIDRYSLLAHFYYKDFPIDSTVTTGDILLGTVLLIILLFGHIPDIQHPDKTS